MEAGEGLKADRQACRVLTYLGGTLCSKGSEAAVKVCLCSLCFPDVVMYIVIPRPGPDSEQQAS